MQYQNIGHLLEQSAARWPHHDAIAEADVGDPRAESDRLAAPRQGRGRLAPFPWVVESLLILQSRLAHARRPAVY
jgi:hypothetical protein